jgi:diadenosine tetraphosphate (Ap4A) HIT family hydrolase
MFELHPKLKADLILLGSFKLSQVFIMPDGEIPWVVLVPQRIHLKEWHELSMADQIELLLEINKVSRVLMEEFTPDKLNVASLGNKVPQFHLHLICRYQTDRAWPQPIWGTYSEPNQVKVEERRFRLKNLLNI